MLNRATYPDRTQWLAGRNKSIGASEAAAVIGVSPFESAYELWERKTGRKRPKDLDGNAAVEYGNRLEPAMRTMFQAEHPELKLEYHQFDVLSQSDRPWATATLDGELTDGDGRKGILEIKTAQISKSIQWERWKDQVPQGYFVQILHQLNVTDWDYVYLFAKLVKLNGDSELRTYRFERTDNEENMAWLAEMEEKFWKEHVMTGVPPAQTIPSL